jgi:hypothetical protein
MKLTTEELPEIESANEADIRRILAEDVFGKFAILSASETAFIQAACVWDPGKECAKFMEETGSDPFILEYRDAKTGRLFAATTQLTLDQITQVFLEYLQGDESWQSRFTWKRVKAQ